MKNPSLTIVIPTLNEEHNLPRCLQSIRKQNFEGKIVVYVADGGSSDKTRDIAKQYGAIVLNNPKRTGEHGKMVGLKRCKTKYFMYLDADIDLIERNYIASVLKPFVVEDNVTATFSGYKSVKSDTSLNKYISFDFLQRDPMFIYLTTSISRVLVAKRKTYSVLKYTPNNLLPSGLSVYKYSVLKQCGILEKEKFMELDVVKILVDKGYDLFCYVRSVHMHHPFISKLSTLVKKRRRNLSTMYFDQPDKRQWTWIDWNSWSDILRLLLWVIYVNTLVGPVFVGLIKVIRHKSIVGLYELPFSWLTTNIVLIAFIERLLRKRFRLSL